MKIAFYQGDKANGGGYGCMRLDQYERLQEETRVVVAKHMETDPKVKPHVPVPPLLVVETDDLRAV